MRKESQLIEGIRGTGICIERERESEKIRRERRREKRGRDKWEDSFRLRWIGFLIQLDERNLERFSKS